MPIDPFSETTRSENRKQESGMVSPEPNGLIAAAVLATGAWLLCG
ncbi:MAG: hypothetical protein ACHRXM_18130 [Isosphaerales bacterium]